MYSTLSLPNQYKGACAAGDQDTSSSTIVYNTYYQWVPLYLLILSALFYVPRVIWSKLEGGVQKHLSKNKTERNIDDIDSKKEKKDRLIDVS